MIRPGQWQTTDVIPLMKSVVLQAVYVIMFNKYALFWFCSDHGEAVSLCSGVPAKLDQRAAAQTQAPAGQMLPEMQGQ